MLWLAVHLPHLALEVFPRETATGPWAVYHGPDNRPLVFARNRAAARSGIRPGMPLGAARALCAELHACRRELDAERAALDALALWALQFSSAVHRRAEEGLLLEIGGSLRLFGGLQRIVRQLAEGLAALAYHPRLGIAPTPLGAWLLGRAGLAAPVSDGAELRRRLAQLPLAMLELEPHSLEALHGMGLRHTGELLALPRAELARRLGPALPHYLDRALGLAPDPLPPFQPPARFKARLPLPAEVEHSEALLFAARRLVLMLVGYLRARGAGVLALQLRLEHRNRPASEIPVGLVRPSRDAEHLLGLLRERLERFSLPAPTDAVALHADAFHALESSHRDLFAGDDSEGLPWQALVERLRARLGEGAVCGLALPADHRPERAWGTTEPGKPVLATTVAERPLWLLREPRPLEPQRERLRLTRGPERLESGWWDGNDLARDYFVAETPEGVRLWIYHDRRGAGWFVQGIFA